MSAAVLVVGAGPTGLVLALALTRAGVPVRIVDQRPRIEPESRALDVQARTLELYRQLGVADRIIAAGVPIEQLAVRVGGRVGSATDVRQLGRGLSPYPFLLCCPQDDHEAILADELAALGVPVERDTELVALSQDERNVTVTIRGRDGDVEEAEFGYLCGCDGADSTVRRLTGVDFAGTTSEQSFFVADVVASSDATPSPLAYGAFSFCLSDDDFLLLVPARRHGTHRVIGLVPAALGPVEALTFEDLRPMVERATSVRVTHVGWFSTYRVSHRVAARFRTGRTFLLGDAGHVHSPLGGQGMNTGIADGVNLAWKLAAVVRGRADESLLDTYERERIGFARSLVATTDRVFGWIAGTGVGHGFARWVLFRILLPGALHWPPVRTAVIGGISQLRVSYRDAKLGRGRVRRVRGGDRLPWVAFADGSDNFQPLVSLDWQLHVYGVATRELRGAGQRLGVALHQFGWSATARAAGLRRDALYLVRPDGYVALADVHQRVARLEDALGRFSARGHDGEAPTLDTPTEARK